VSNIVELKARRGAPDTTAQATDKVYARADLRALHDLQTLCAKALAAGGLDAGGPTVLDLTVAMQRTLKGTEWNARFYRGQGSGL
jgi:hypothetical protein